MNNIGVNRSKPVLLLVGGLDPSGGAGVVADVEVAQAFGCHPCVLVTALTAQDTRRVAEFKPVDEDLFTRQAEMLAADCTPVAIKIGMIADRKVAGAVARLLRKLPEVPVVLDPVLASGAGDALSNGDLTDFITADLAPLCSLITPNVPELAQLSRRETQIDAQARSLIASGCPCVLVTGTHAPTPTVVNRLFDSAGAVIATAWRRLPGDYHGSGCTLASAVACGLALGRPLIQVVADAQAYTWAALDRGYSLGSQRLLPARGDSVLLIEEGYRRGCLA